MSMDELGVGAGSPDVEKQFKDLVDKPEAKTPGPEPAPELQVRRLFRVFPCANETALENTLNKLEEAGAQIGDIFHKPTGGFAVVAFTFVHVHEEKAAPGPEQTKGEQNETEAGVESDPPETI